jgi:shikimate kinase
MTSDALPHISKTIVLVGLMGAGKTCIGSRLAERLGLPFVDADAEIEKAAGCSISDIFELYGEAAFRDGERRVIARLLTGPVQVLATGGGAFIDPTTRAQVRDSAISVWLRADLALLLSRTVRRNNRPLLRNGERRETLKRLMEERHPIYAEADIVIDSARESPDATVERLIGALRDYLDAPKAAEAAG